MIAEPVLRLPGTTAADSRGLCSSSGLCAGSGLCESPGSIGRASGADVQPWASVGRLAAASDAGDPFTSERHIRELLPLVLARYLAGDRLLGP